MSTKGDTFYALSSAPGRSAISSTRISGPMCLEATSKLTKTNKNLFIHKKATVVNIYNINNNLIDRVVVVYFKGPNSYTGDDLVEIHTHGNPKITQNLFNALNDLGLRLADPGEFTRTAYLNKKLDLIQAESIASLINSQTNKGISLSLQNVFGHLSTKLKELKGVLVSALEYIEYELDISDEDNSERIRKKTIKTIRGSLLFIADLLTSHESAKVLSDGARIAIVGAPNSGKSTLFNSLLNYQRAIVADSPGTTRDTIEDSLNISNYSVLLVDTAGIRKTTNRVELSGIERSNNEINNSDLIYYVLDLSTNTKKPKLKTSTPVIYTYNKVDLVSKKKINNIKKGGDNVVFISAKTQEGLQSLKEKTGDFLGSIINKNSEFFITSVRQKNILNNIKTILENALGGEATNEIELLAFELKLAIEQFDWLLGKTTADDILNNLFSDFCVGK